MINQNKHIAIIADWLIDFGGAELVISHLLEIFPDADIYTSVCFMNHPMLKGRRVHTSWLQKIPFLNRRHKLAGILRPWAFRSFDLSGYDIVICSSSAESKQVAMGKWNCGKSVQMGVRGEDTVGTMMKNSTKNSKASTEGVGLPTETFDTFGYKSMEVKKPKVIVYCHTPIRYYWSHYEEYRNMMEFGILNPIARFVLDSLIGWLRKLDFEASQRVDYFIANSENTQERIKRYYKRESGVIYPGVDIEKICLSLPYANFDISVSEDFREKSQTVGVKGNETYPKGISNATKLQRGSFCDLGNQAGTDSQNEAWKKKTFGTFGHESTENNFGTFGNKSTETENGSEEKRNLDCFVPRNDENQKKMGEYYISIGRCIPYKKFDLLVDTFNKNRKSLILVTNTDNRLYQTLREKSKPNITWKLCISQEEKNTLLRGARGFLFPPLEDFGLVPIEAMALGIPVIAYGKGGATETVIEGLTGVFFDEQTIASLSVGIDRFEKLEFNQEKIRTHAKEFDKTIFQRKIIDFIESNVQ